MHGISFCLYQYLPGIGTCTGSVFVCISICLGLVHARDQFLSVSVYAWDQYMPEIIICLRLVHAALHQSDQYMPGISIHLGSEHA